MARRRKDCTLCGDVMREVEDEPGLYECSGCGDLRTKSELLRLDLEEQQDDYDDDEEASWESYGRHRTRLRDSDE